MEGSPVVPVEVVQTSRSRFRNLPGLLGLHQLPARIFFPDFLRAKHRRAAQPLQSQVSQPAPSVRTHNVVPSCFCAHVSVCVGVGSLSVLRVVTSLDTHAHRPAVLSRPCFFSFF